MRLHDGIREHGFRKWYERELTRSHLFLLLLLLAAIGGFGSLELLSFGGPPASQLGNLLLLLVCAGVGIWSLHRYLFLLMRAEYVARQAVCPNCQAYGRLILVHDQPQGEQSKVSCRTCAHEWQIADPDPA